MFRRLTLAAVTFSSSEYWTKRRPFIAELQLNQQLQPFSKLKFELLLLLLMLLPPPSSPLPLPLPLPPPLRAGEMCHSHRDPGQEGIVTKVFDRLRLILRTLTIDLCVIMARPRHSQPMIGFGHASNLTKQAIVSTADTEDIISGASSSRSGRV